MFRDNCCVDAYVKLQYYHYITFKMYYPWEFRGFQVLTFSNEHGKYRARVDVTTHYLVSHNVFEWKSYFIIEVLPENRVG